MTLQSVHAPAINEGLGGFDVLPFDGWHPVRIGVELARNGKGVEGAGVVGVVGVSHWNLLLRGTDGEEWIKKGEVIASVR